MSKDMEAGMKHHAASTFWGGGQSGVMLQITTIALPGVGISDPELVLQQPGFIQLDLEEAAELHATLGEYIKQEALRRQGLLKAQLEKMQIASRTVLSEVAALSSDLLDCGARKVGVGLIVKFCPIAEE